MVPKNLRPLIPYFKKYQRAYIIGAICVLVTNITWAVFPQVIRRAMDDLTRSGVNYKILRLYGMDLIGIVLLKGLFQFLTRWIVIGISRDIEFDLLNDLFGHLEQLSYAYYQRTRTGDIMAKATNDLNAV